MYIIIFSNTHVFSGTFDFLQSSDFLWGEFTSYKLWFSTQEQENLKTNWRRSGFSDRSRSRNEMVFCVFLPLNIFTELLGYKFLVTTKFSISSLTINLLDLPEGREFFPKIRQTGVATYTDGYY